VVTCPENQDVSFAEAHAFGLFGGLEVGPRDSFARLQPWTATQARDVQKHATPDDAIGVSRDIEGRPPWLVRSDSGRPP